MLQDAKDNPVDRPLSSLREATPRQFLRLRPLTVWSRPRRDGISPRLKRRSLLYHVPSCTRSGADAARRLMQTRRIEVDRGR